LVNATLNILFSLNETLFRNFTACQVILVHSFMFTRVIFYVLLALGSCAFVPVNRYWCLALNYVVHGMMRTLRVGNNSVAAVHLGGFFCM
jgi:hypothetical protein